LRLGLSEWRPRPRSSVPRDRCIPRLHAPRLHAPTAASCSLPSLDLSWTRYSPRLHRAPASALLQFWDNMGPPLAASALPLARSIGCPQWLMLIICTQLVIEARSKPISGHVLYRPKAGGGTVSWCGMRTPVVRLFREIPDCPSRRSKPILTTASTRPWPVMAAGLGRTTAPSVLGHPSPPQSGAPRRLEARCPPRGQLEAGTKVCRAFGFNAASATTRNLVKFPT
jgi:hypothetical protein